MDLKDTDPQNSLDHGQITRSYAAMNSAVLGISILHLVSFIIL